MKILNCIIEDDHSLLVGTCSDQSFDVGSFFKSNIQGVDRFFELIKSTQESDKFVLVFKENGARPVTEIDSDSVVGCDIIPFEGSIFDVLTNSMFSVLSYQPG